MASRPEEFAPVEAISDEERRKLVRALVAGEQMPTQLLQGMRHQDRAIELIKSAVESFLRM
jgi:hypothetical protein